MRRRAFDRLVSITGLFLAVILIVAGALLTWAHNFIDNEVSTQLSSQQIFFPAKGSPATAGADFAPMRKYAGQQLTTGAQAETYADHFIAIHLKEIGGGKTYAQLSTAAQADPTNLQLAAKVDTVFKGETLRGLLLNAYAFGTMGRIAGIAAFGAFIGAAVLAVLGALGLWHGARAGGTRPQVSAALPPVPVAAAAVSLGASPTGSPPLGSPPLGSPPLGSPR